MSIIEEPKIPRGDDFGDDQTKSERGEGGLETLDTLTTVNVPVVVFITCFYLQSFVLAVGPKFQQIQAALRHN
jgi:hypothetical protein